MRRPGLRCAPALILAFELLGDLVHHLDALRADPRVDRSELGGLGLEPREGGEDLARGDEPTLLDHREQAFDAACLATVLGGADSRVRRVYGGGVVRAAGLGSIDPVGVSRVFGVSRHVLLPRPSFSSARATAHPTNCSAS